MHTRYELYLPPINLTPRQLTKIDNFIKIMANPMAVIAPFEKLICSVAGHESITTQALPAVMQTRFALIIIDWRQISIITRCLLLPDIWYHEI